jgi:hypothetical protein
MESIHLSNQTSEDIEEGLINDIAQFTYDPEGYVDYAFPWDEKDSQLEGERLRAWQRGTLRKVSEHLTSPHTRFNKLLISVASGHGIGKSAFFGMITKWALDTCEDTRIVVTANTDGQLKSKTVPEIQKWHRMAITSHWFKNTATAIYSNCDGHDKSWRCDFLPWSAENPEAFAGLHNKRKRILIIFDEASGIDEKIWETVEGALTDEETEIIWIAFGNPTRNTGFFRETFRKHAKFWDHVHIDSRDVEGTDKKLFERWEEQFGEDSDFFRVRVRGQFPNLSSNQLIGVADVEKAQGKHLREEQYSFAPKIISVDPAWTGGDEMVIAMRQGLHFQILETFEKNDDDVSMMNIIARLEDEHRADAVFLDGGYGTGIYSAGKAVGRYHWRLVWFSGKSGREDCVNKRTEMAVEVRDWLKEGGAIPDDNDLFEEMIAQELKGTLDGKYKLAPKDEIKEVVGRSPNRFDALAITFAFPVSLKRNVFGEKPGDNEFNSKRKLKNEYDREKLFDD